MGPHRVPSVVRRRSGRDLRASARAGGDPARLDLAAPREEPARLHPAAEADESGPVERHTRMKRISGIVAVLALSRIALLAGHDLTWSWWSPAAYLWHDAGVLLVYAAVDRGLRRSPRLAWAAYAVFVACVAISVPVCRALSTPMPCPMWRAAGGPLADSVWYYVTPGNLAWVGVVLLGALGAPFVVGRSAFFVPGTVEPRTATVEWRTNLERDR